METVITPTITFAGLYQAYRDCRKRKRGTANAQRYDMHLLDNLFQTEAALQSRSYSPSRSIRFVVKKPKAREIHAADFQDRVVHHWLVPRLERLFEPVFIHDVYSNRKGKGTHKAVARIQSFIHSLAAAARESDIPAGRTVYDTIWYLQLDIANFFNRIDCPMLFRLIQQRLRKAIRQQKVMPAEADTLRWLCHVLLKHDTTVNARYRGDPRLLDRVPEHKQLGSLGGTKKGLPIGNLTSQFFANVYMNPLDQFVKHELKCRYYVRYVDDFILLANSQQQLIAWREQIIQFLQSHLQLALKVRTEPHPVSQGIDFLGYITHPHYRLVRRRVVGNLREKLQRYQRQLIQGNLRDGYRLTLNEPLLESLGGTLASYWGHFHHANSYHLRQQLIREFAWLSLLLDTQTINHQTLRLNWQPLPGNVTGYRSQLRYFQRQFPTATLQVQRGMELDVIPAKITTPLPPCLHHQVERVIVREAGFLRGGLKRRRIYRLFIKPGVEIC